MFIKRILKTIKKYQNYFILSIIIIAFYFPFIFLNDKVMDDLGAFYTPHLQFINNELKEGRIPFWFHYYHFGMPEFFKVELGFFNPIFFTYYVLNFLFNTNNSIFFTHELREYYIIVFILLSSVSFLHFTKKLFNNKIDDPSLVIAATAYAINSFIFDMSTLVHGTVFIAIPPIAYFTKKLITSELLSRKDLLIYIFLNYFVFSTGYVSYFIYLFTFQAIIAFYYNFKKSYKLIFPYLISFGLSMYFFLPYLGIIKDSNRSEIELNHKVFSIVPYKWFELLNPDLGIQNIFNFKNFFSEPYFTYGSIFLPLIILGIHIILTERKNMWVIYCLFIFFLYSSGNYFGVIDLIANYFPQIKYIRSHYQASIIINYLISTLIFIGLSKVNDFKNSLNKIIYLLLGISLTLTLYILYVDKVTNKENQFISWIFVISQLGILFIINKYSKRISYIVCAIFICISLITNTEVIQNKVSPTYSSKSIYARSNLINAIPNHEMFRTEFIHSQFTANASYFNLVTFHGYDSLYPKSFMRIDKENLANISVKNVVSDTEVKNNDYKLINVIKNDGNTYFGYLKPEFYYIYEITNPVPNYFSPLNIQKCEKEFCASEKNSRIKVRYSGEETFSNTSPNYSIEILESNSNGDRLKITSDSRRFIASRENMLNGWEILINEKPSKLYYVDEGFKGFFVDEGTSDVRLKYTPPLFKEGFVITLVSLLLLIIKIFLL